eukprot:13423579-Alexandrium_andersonii.AAC.1
MLLGLLAGHPYLMASGCPSRLCSKRFAQRAAWSRSLNSLRTLCSCSETHRAERRSATQAFRK